MYLGGYSAVESIGALKALSLCMTCWSTFVSLFYVMWTLEICRIFAAEVPTTTTVSLARRCPKCGTIKKSGKRSCCARGGSWFKKCGDADDAEFDHTWTEGIGTCQGFAASALVNASTQVRYRDVGVIAHAQSTTQRSNTTHADSTSRIDITASEDCVESAKVAICVCVLFFWPLFQT